jgi:drug/metabolite transporter (DMT)-like permease
MPGMDAASGPVLRSVALILAGVALLGFTDNLVRLFAAEAGLWQFHLLRSAMALPLLVLAACAFGLPLRPRRWGPLAARSLAQAAAMLLYFGSLPFVPIAQAAAALFTAPLFVLIFAAGLFGHRIGPWQLAAVALGFAGILVLLRPEPANIDALTFVPVAAGALYGLSNLLTREWCADEPVAALLAGFFLALGLAGAAGAVLLAALPAQILPGAEFLTRPWTPALSLPALGVLLVQAAGSLVAVGCIARGYQTGETSQLTVFEYFFLVSASFWAWVIWGEALHGPDYLGIAMIFASGAMVAGARGDASPPARADAG